MSAESPIYSDLSAQGIESGSDRSQAAAVGWPEGIRRSQHTLWSGWGAAPFSIGARVVFSGDTTITQRVIVPPGTARMQVQLDLLGSGQVRFGFDGEGVATRDYAEHTAQPPGRAPGVIVGVALVAPLATGLPLWAHREQTLTMQFYPDTETTIQAMMFIPLFVDADDPHSFDTGFSDGFAVAGLP